MPEDSRLSQEVERSAERPKVLFLHQGGELYGSDMFFYQTIKALSACVEPIVVLDDTGPLVEKLQGVTDSIIIRRLGVLRRRVFSPSGIVQYVTQVVGSTLWLARFVRREDIKLVYTNTLSVLSGATTSRLTGRPHAWHVLEMIVSPAWLSRLLAFIAATFSDRIIAISDAVARHLTDRWRRAKDKIEVVYIGLDPTTFRSTSEETIRKEFGIDEDTFLVGLVGRVHFWKGQDFLIDTVHLMKAAGFSDFRALIVGDVFEGYEAFGEALRDRVNELGLTEEIIFCGFRRDVPAIMKELDVLVVPSMLPEPFGLVSLEGMACAKPVIATAHGGAVEIIEDGVTGYLVPPDAPQVMAERLMQLASDRALRESMGEAGWRRLVEKFSLARFDQGIRNVVLDVLDGYQDENEIGYRDENRIDGHAGRSGQLQRL